MTLLIFDRGSPLLGPLTDLRPAFDVRTGIVRTRTRIERSVGHAADALWVPDHLVGVVSADTGGPVNTIPNVDEMLIVNGAWLLPDVAAAFPAHQLMMTTDGELLAARLSPEQARAFLTMGELPDTMERRVLENALILGRPWDVIRHRNRLVEHDAGAHRLVEARVVGDAECIIGEQAIEIHETAQIAPHVVLDATDGPVIIDEHAVIRPGAILCGPCYVGRCSVVVDRAHIKPYTVIGPVCKVGGEVGGTIFQGYCNKSHEGHLGDSWVGEWVNLGAGTTNSNLLNTYGEVTMRADTEAPRERTGMQFVGSIIGDHVKTAIGTRLMTGTTIGIGAMIASSKPPPTAVRPFAWITDDGVRVFRANKFIETARTVMARRSIEMTDTYRDALMERHVAAEHLTMRDVR